MKNYKEFSQVCIGCSDIASLIMRDAEGVRELKFGDDGCYRAYECFGNDVEIGAHYKEQFTLKSWVTIYDDECKMYSCHSADVDYKLCTVYRAGDFGCILHWHD